MCVAELNREAIIRLLRFLEQKCGLEARAPREDSRSSLLRDFACDLSQPESAVGAQFISRTHLQITKVHIMFFTRDPNENGHNIQRRCARDELSKETAE
jgi:hypothetical protein